MDLGPEWVERRALRGYDSYGARYMRVPHAIFSLPALIQHRRPAMYSTFFMSVRSSLHRAAGSP